MPRKKLVSKIPSTKTITLFIIGLALICVSTYWNFYQSRVLSFTGDKTQIATPYFSSFERDMGKTPIKILIEKVAINLPIVESKVVNGVWEINSTGGSHLSSSARPNENGNIVLYGHNKPKLFRRVLKLKVGDQIKLRTLDDSEFNYRVFSIDTVEPTEISVLAPTDGEVLTFYTCTGFLDSQRLVIKASADILP
jgi:LPXTG-site transpeptidase (sortase) family protein